LEIIEEAYISRVHDIGTIFVFIYREEFTRAFLLFEVELSVERNIVFRSSSGVIEFLFTCIFLEDFVLPSTRVGTGTLVRIASRKII
jgi:hypothetical protein